MDKQPKRNSESLGFDPRTSGRDPDFPWRRALIVGLLTIGVFVYSAAVLVVVALAGDVGLHCVFGPRIQEVEDRTWSQNPETARVALRGETPPPGQFAKGPRVNDRLTALGETEIRNYTDYIRAMRKIQGLTDQFVEARWTDPEEKRAFYGYVRVERPSFWAYWWSFCWFVQELLIYATGAWVFWKRPRDESARVFFGLCVATVIAYMGGYHWGQIAKYALLIFPFAAFVVFVPILSLHFYLIFPRDNPIFAAHRKRILAALYGFPALTASGIWAAMLWSRLREGDEVQAALDVLRWLALGYIAASVGVFLLCLACLTYSYFRKDLSRAERNQVRWIFLATFLSVFPIAWLLWNVAINPAQLGLSRSAWPMFVVSLFYTVAYALSITRYKLMQAEELFNRGKIYVAVSMAAGLLYSGGLVVGALIIGEQLKANQTSLGTVVACATALVVLSLSGVLRRWVQSALDRRFHREKYKFDQAMRRMSEAVGSLVDRPTLGRRLLDAAGEVLRAEWGAIYLGHPDTGPLTLAACAGPEPDQRSLGPDNPLVARLQVDRRPLRVAHAMALAPSSDPATDAMIALGGEVAAPLEAEGVVVGLLVLGPKRSGLPYEDEEIAFLGALGSVAVLALRSADIQRTLESLNRELREKVDKISEQQRRILILQDQLAGQNSPERDFDGRDEVPEPAAEPPRDAIAFGSIRGSGPAVRQMITMARKVAASPSAVLIRGESGTGKELLAESIHRASPRADKPFVKVHCAALSQSLLESELFGHVKGAFTDAKSDRVGRFQQADGGTLFLDEIGDINLEVQTKLLRVLQEMQFERVGSSQTITVDVRILAATHQDLEALIRSGRFREDLYYRLNVISVRMPALRERREDIFELSVHFLNQHARRLEKSVTQLDDAAIEALVSHDWPGNIRELENVLERAVVLADGPAVTLDDLPPEIRRSPSGRKRSRMATSPPRVLAGPVSAPSWGLAEGRNSNVDGPASSDDDLDPEAFDYERARLIEALSEARGNKSEAARLLAMPRSTFFSKLKKHGLT